MKITLHKGDITNLSVDCIVNAANSSLLGGGGVDGAIHRYGGPSILADCMRIRQRTGGCPTGEAVITTAGSLPANYVIHTVGPVWQGGVRGESKLLRSCYLNTLKLADKHNIKTLSFPNISTGVFSFPKKEAAKIAIRAIKDYNSNNDTKIEEIFLVCFDDENFQIYEQIL